MCSPVDSQGGGVDAALKSIHEGRGERWELCAGPLRGLGPQSSAVGLRSQISNPLVEVETCWYLVTMESETFEECDNCTRLIFPGEELFLHGKGPLCSDCHENVATVFAGKFFCH